MHISLCQPAGTTLVIRVSISCHKKMTPPHPNSSENIGWRLLVFVGVFTPLQTIFVALRFYARSLVRSPWAWDDGLIVTALLGQFVAAGIAIGE